MKVSFEQIFSPHGFLLTQLKQCYADYSKESMTWNQPCIQNHSENSLYSAHFSTWNYCVEHSKMSCLIASDLINTQQLNISEEDISLFFQDLIQSSILKSLNQNGTSNSKIQSILEEASEFIQTGVQCGGHQLVQLWNEKNHSESLIYCELTDHQIVLFHFAQFLKTIFAEHRYQPLFLIQSGNRLSFTVPQSFDLNTLMNHFEEFYVYTKRPVLNRNSKNGDIVLRNIYSYEQLIQTSQATLKGLTIHIDDLQKVKRIFSGWYSYQTYVKMENIPPVNKKIFAIVYFDPNQTPTLPKNAIYLNALTITAVLRGQFDRFKSNLSFQSKIQNLIEFLGDYFQEFIQRTELDISTLKRETQQSIYAVILSTYLDVQKIDIQLALDAILKNHYPTYPDNFKEAYHLFKHLRNQLTKCPATTTSETHTDHSCIVCNSPAQTKMESHFFPILSYIHSGIIVQNGDQKLKKPTYICSQCLMQQSLIIHYAEESNTISSLKSPPNFFNTFYSCINLNSIPKLLTKKQFLSQIELNNVDEHCLILDLD